MLQEEHFLEHSAILLTFIKIFDVSIFGCPFTQVLLYHKLFCLLYNLNVLGKLYLCPYSGIKMSEKYTYITRFYASYLHILFPFRAGRKKTLYFCLMLLMAASFAITFTPEYYSFVVLQFIIGAGCLGTWMAAFVAGMY